MKVWVGRSPWRLVLYSVIGAVMVLMALDVAVSYRFYPLPDATESTVTAEDGTETVVRALTRDGEAQRRRDVAVGIGFGLAGALVLGWSAREAIVRKPLMLLDDDGLAVRSGGRGKPPLRLAWDEIVEIRSGVRSDDAGRTPVLSIRPADPDRLPAEVRGGIVEPPWLHLFSEEWDVPARQVAPIAAQYVGDLLGLDQYE